MPSKELLGRFVELIYVLRSRITRVNEIDGEGLEKQVVVEDTEIEPDCFAFGLLDCEQKIEVIDRRGPLLLSCPSCTH